MIKKIYIDPKILNAVRGITYTKPNIIDIIKMLFGIKFRPVEIVRPSLMSLIPRVQNPYPKSLYSVGSVTTQKKKESAQRKKKVHYNYCGAHLCNHAVDPFPEMITTKWREVTCKNCMRVNLYH